MLLFYSWTGSEIKDFGKLFSGSAVNMFSCVTALKCVIVFQVIKASEDSTLQYMNFMNVIFAAQKKVGITAELTSSDLILFF